MWGFSLVGVRGNLMVVGPLGGRVLPHLSRAPSSGPDSAQPVARPALSPRRWHHREAVAVQLPVRLKPGRRYSASGLAERVEQRERASRRPHARARRHELLALLEGGTERPCPRVIYQGWGPGPDRPNLVPGRSEFN